jgi:hypothetical protein
LRIGHSFQGGKSFWGNNEQRLGSVQIANGLEEIGAIDVGDEAECHVALAVMPQGFIGHNRPEVGPADADVDDVANALAGMAFPCTHANLVREFGHPVEDRMNLGNHVPAVDDDGCAAGRSQSRVEHGAVFGDVDFVSRKHHFNSGRKVRLRGQLEQKL